MKKTIKLAATLASIGAMLATTGCRHIYDGIDYIVDEVYQIKNTDLVNLRNKIDNYISDLHIIDSTFRADDAALKAELTLAYKVADNVLAGTIATKADELAGDYTGKISALRGELEEAVARLDSTDVELASQIIAAVNAFKQADSIMNESFTAADAALEQSIVANALKIAGVDSTLSAKVAEIYGAIGQNKTDLDTRIDSLLGAHNAGMVTLAQVVIDLADLQTLVDQYDQNIRSKITADSTAAWGKIIGIENDYLQKYAELVAVDTNINGVLGRFYKEYAAKISELETKDGNIEGQISTFHGEYDIKIADIEGRLKNGHEVDSLLQEQVDTLVAGAYGRITAVRAELETSILNAIDSAKNYTDAQIAALDIENKLQTIRQSLADSCSHIYQKIADEKAAIEAKYDAALDQIKSMIQSIVALPAKHYEIVNYSLEGKAFGNKKITAQFEVKPADAVLHITAANASLYVYNAYNRNNASVLSTKYTNPEVIDTVLTGSAFTKLETRVENGRGFVTVQAMLPTDKGEQPSAVVGRKGTYFALGVSGYATSTHNDIQSAFVMATETSLDLAESFGWYEADKLCDAQYVCPDDSVCYCDGIKPLGVSLTPKVSHSGFYGDEPKSLAELGSYVGDSLWISYKFFINGNETDTLDGFKVAVADTLDTTFATSFIATTDGRKKNNPAAGKSFNVEVIPCLRNGHGLEVELPLRWTALRHVVKYNFGELTCTLPSIGWAWENGADKTDTAFVSVSSEYFTLEDLAESTVESTSNALQSISEAFVSDSELGIVFKVDYDTVAVADTITFSVDNGRNYGTVKVIAAIDPAPVFKGSATIGITPSASWGDTVDLAFTNVVPYYEGVADLSCAGLPENFAEILTGEIPDESLDGMKIAGVDSIAYKPGLFNYDSTYTGTIAFVSGNESHAKYKYEFDYTVNTSKLAFGMASKAPADTVDLIGTYEGGKYSIGQIDLSEYYQVLKEGEPYNCPAEEKVTAVVDFGANQHKVAEVTDGQLEETLVTWDENDTILVCTAYSRYGGTDGTRFANADTVTIVFRTKQPISYICIQDSTFYRNDALTITAQLNSLSNEIVDFAGTNLWDDLEWEQKSNGNLVGTLPQIDSTTITFEFAKRVTYMNGNAQAISATDFNVSLDESGKPILMISKNLTVANYRMEFNYKVRHLFDTDAPNEHNGRVSFQFLDDEQ